MNTVAILLSAFVLSFVALLVFIWSQHTGLFDRSSKGAEVIFASGEIGRIEEPAAATATQDSLQDAIDTAGAGPATHADALAPPLAPPLALALASVYYFLPK